VANPIIPQSSRKRIGIALGSGSARGIAHVGILQALREMDVEPDIVCGSSIGSLVGACYLTGHLDEFSKWVSGLSTTAVLRFMGIRLLGQGGVAEAGRLIQHLRDNFGDPAIEDLPKPYAAVATDLYRGREVWIQQGSVWDAVRASIAIPGLLTPVPYGDRWLVDGGLVNPVPVSLCRALGADVIIAVNLNSIRRQQPESTIALPTAEEAEAQTEEETLAAEELPAPEANLFGRFSSSLRGATGPLRQLWASGGSPQQPLPGTLNVVLSTINVMQDRITRSRLAGEPPDVVLAPRLAQLGLLEFNRGAEAVAEGRACVERMQESIRHALEM
jgi:NTE family protein